MSILINYLHNHPNTSNLYITILPNKSLALVNSVLITVPLLGSPIIKIYSKLLSPISALATSTPSTHMTTSLGQNPPYPTYRTPLIVCSFSNLIVTCCGSPWSEFQQVSSLPSNICFFPNCLWSFWKTEETVEVCGWRESKLEAGADSI